jgi:acyl carrier protein
MDAIKETLFNYIRNSFDIEDDDEDLTADVHLFDYGYIDSFGAVKLISFIEENYGVKITNRDLMMYSLNTINEITDLIKMKLEDKK